MTKRRSATQTAAGLPKDKTSKARQERFVENIRKSNGRRLSGWLGQPEAEAIDYLIEAGYETNTSAVVRKAVVEVAKRQKKT
jgi:hypothetical protein